MSWGVLHSFESAQSPRRPSHSITVNSSEKVAVEPDIAQVEYAVRTEASDAAACQQNNTESVSQVIDLLRSLNIQETSIQTSNYYMNPV